MRFFFKKNIELISAVSAALFFIAAVIPYLYNFGTSWSKDNAVWGQFGDYLGGSLNPVFGLLTLLVVLYNTRMQRSEIKRNRSLMVRHTRMLNRQLELSEQKAIEELTFQLLDEARTDKTVQKASDKEVETLLGIFSIHINADGQYEEAIENYSERAKVASEHFRERVGIEFGAFNHIVYPKLLALVSCVNKLPEQNRIFLTNLIKSRFSMGVISAVVQLSIALDRKDDYEEFKKLTPLLQGVGENLIFSKIVCEDFCNWLTPKEMGANVIGSQRTLMEVFKKKDRKS